MTSDRGRSLSTRRTSRIGVVVEDLDNPFYLELLDVLHERLERADVRMIVLTPQRNDPERVERLVDGSIDGAILTTTHLDSPIPAQLRSRHFPFVLLNRTVDDPAYASCAVDNRAGAIRLAEETLRAGPPRDRRGVRPGDDEHGPRPRGGHPRGPRGRRACRCRPSARGAGASPSRAATAGAPSCSRRDDRPTAVLCANDVVAFGAINAARGLGLARPRRREHHRLRRHRDGRVGGLPPHDGAPGPAADGRDRRRPRARPRRRSAGRAGADRPARRPRASRDARPARRLTSASTAVGAIRPPDHTRARRRCAARGLGPPGQRARAERHRQQPERPAAAGEHERRGRAGVVGRGARAGGADDAPIATAVASQANASVTVPAGAARSTIA